jgi:alpha-amylase/alpha-mannosidase (GH57 family)
MRTALVVHGHFYQPPRENPWTDIVEREAGARPFHDWNERIYSECYRPNAFARIVDSFGRVERIVNNYANISFNFGPTLLSWMERHHAETYRRILEADRESMLKHGGHGNAIAQGYNHVIIPLCNERDGRTQVRWGIADFRRRFEREPESLWLPETGCDERTLDLLIDEGLRYVILSPYQAARVRSLVNGEWRDVSDGTIDTSIPYKHFHSDKSGRSIAIFFYDGPIAKSIAFEGALASSRGLVDRFARATTGEARLVNVATDGETYGHHFKFGDRCLAYALEVEAPSQGFRVTNHGEFLDHHPPTMEVALAKGLSGEGTSWSCAHGLGRWTRDCGCQTGAEEGWNQSWRAPLREALDLLRDEAARYFEATRGELFRDPWAARDDYIELMLDRHASPDAFLERHAGKRLDEAQRVRALTFLEMQRHAMVMYTSCGWFFADLAGIETVQVMRYAGRVMELMEELGLESRRDEFLQILSQARSNVPALGNGADIYKKFVEASVVTPQRVAAHLSISGLVDRNQETGEVAGFAYRLAAFQKQQHGRLTLSTCHLVLDSLATGKRHEYAVASMYFGDVDFYCVLRPYTGAFEFKSATEQLWMHYRTGSVPSILRHAQELFGPDEYGLEHLLPDGRESISGNLFRRMVDIFSEQYELLYEDNRRNIEMLQEAGFELPKELRSAAEFTIGRRFEKELRKQKENFHPAAYMRALELSEEAARHGYRIKRSAIWRQVEEMIAKTVRYTVANPTSENIQLARMLIQMTEKLGFNANLDQAQEAVYEALRQGLPVSDEMHELAFTLGLSSGLLQQRPLPLPDEVATTRAGALPS